MKKFWKSLLVIMPALLLVLTIVFCNMPTNRPKESQSVEVKDVGDNAGIVWAGSSNTGASSATKDQKGGAIFLEPYTTYTMNGGTISNHSTTYGGAIYISEGATFTMKGGTITSCSASYGGGIYVEAGGVCNIEAGSIKSCTASVAGPAIYVEDGATLNLSTTAEVDENEIQDDNDDGFELNINSGTYQLGKTPSSVSLQTAFFGSYPQSKVNSLLTSKLEAWYSDEASVGTYTLGSNVWTAYSYTDGNIYVRGKEIKKDSDSIYKDGTSPTTGNYQWFKVEPIRWYILSINGNDYELFSEIILAANISFNSSKGSGNIWETSHIREWCNGEFFTTAFSKSEQKHIKTTTIGNNVTGNYNSSTSDQSGTATQDQIYLKSYYEMSINPFTSDDLRRAAPSDFAVANDLTLNPTVSDCTTAYAPRKTSYYWLRSAGSSDSEACYLNYRGGLYDGNSVAYSCFGVRPSLHVVV